jgi:hypothetical protein
MKLGASFSPRESALLVTAIDRDGSVAAAGGQTDDVWLCIDGAPAAAVAAEWQSGERPRKPGVPFVVEALREGRPVTLRPMWRSAGTFSHSPGHVSDPSSLSPTAARPKPLPYGVGDEVAAAPTLPAPRIEASELAQVSSPEPPLGEIEIKAPSWADAMRTELEIPQRSPLLDRHRHERDEYITNTSRGYDPFKTVNDAVRRFTGVDR